MAGHTRQLNVSSAGRTCTSRLSVLSHDVHYTMKGLEHTRHTVATPSHTSTPALPHTCRGPFSDNSWHSSSDSGSSAFPREEFDISPTWQRCLDEAENVLCVGQHYGAMEM